MTYQEALQLIAPNIDSYGLIIHNKEEWGGGDTAQREGMWAYGLSIAFPEQRPAIAVNFYKSLQKIKTPTGDFVRHCAVPGAPGWYDDPTDFSRDQSIPLLVAMGRLKLKGELSDFHKATRKRFYRAQNGDAWWWPYYLAMWIRACAEAHVPRFTDYLNPILWLGDFTLVFASIWACIWGKLNPGHSDDVNFVLTLLQSHVLDTPLARIARWVYANFRPAIKGTEETWGPASTLEAYFSPQFTNSGAPRIDLLYNQTGIMKNLIQ